LQLSDFPGFFVSKIGGNGFQRFFKTFLGTRDNEKFGDVVGEERIRAAVSDTSRAASHDGYFAADVGDIVE
jgi:hypothetical protein